MGWIHSFFTERDIKKWEKLENAERSFESFLEREQTQGAARGRLKAAVTLCAGAVAVILML